MPNPATRRIRIGAGCHRSMSWCGLPSAITASSTTGTIQSSWSCLVLRRRPTTMTICRDWHELPFQEIWCVDTEYYPGAGRANGGRDGYAITPLCLVAYEMRTGRTVRLWQDELGRFPPYRLDADALIIGYMISAELG